MPPELLYYPYNPVPPNNVRVNYREGGLYVIYSPEDAQRPRAVYHIQPNFEVIN